tara:strand:- start:10172 stop:10510 length:339 start_codon:yes stop_codon:yes gene_type:complete
MSAHCPSCGQQALALWKKVFLSPLAPMPCESCDIELKVTWSAYLTAISMGSIIFLLVYLQIEIDSIMHYALCIMHSALCVFWYGLYFDVDWSDLFMPLESVVDHSNNYSVDG